MKKFLVIKAVFFPAIVVLFTAGAEAQSVSVMGNSIAHSCYKSAEYAVSSGTGSRRDVDECTRAIQDGMLMRRDLVATHINRGIIRAKLGQIGDAQDDYLAALEISDRSPEIFLNLGNLQFMMQDFSSALADYNHAESLGGLERNQQILYLNRGMVLARMGRFDEAEAEYHVALQYQPGWGNALDQLERLESQREEALEAESEAEQ